MGGGGIIFINRKSRKRYHIFLWQNFYDLQRRNKYENSTYVSIFVLEREKYKWKDRIILLNVILT